MSISRIGDDPFIITEQKADELYKEIHPALSALATESWPALQAKTSELNREINGATFELAKFREDVTELRTSREAAAAAFDKVRTETRAKVDRLHGASQALVDVLRAEVVVKARPKVDAAREQFAREDLRALLDGSSDPLKQMIDIAAGEHRDRAALVIGDFGDSYLQRHVPDKRAREQFREALSASMIQGSIEHGSEQERAAARVVKETLPRVSGWLATQLTPALARLRSAEELRP